MLKYQFSIYRKINIIIDAAITGLSFVAALVFGAHIDTGSFALSLYYPGYLWLFFTVILLWPLLLNINGLYPTDRLRTLKRAAHIITKSSLQGLLIILAIFFVFRLQAISRSIIIGFAFLVTLFLILKESVVIWQLHTLRKSGTNLRHVLVVGTLESTRGLVETIEKNSFLGLEIIGLLVPSEEEQKEEARGHKILGSLKDIEEVLHGNPIDHVILTVDRSDYGEVEDIISRCEEEGVEIWLTASLFNLRIAKLDSDELFGIPLFVFRTVPKFSWQLFIKGLLDVVGAFIFGLLSLPIVVLSAVLIKTTSKGPILFKQKRCGLQGREFTLYKLRTMHAGAHIEKSNLEEENIMKGPVFKLTNDPRVTTVGHFLRKLSIDEMPQFWNVLKGDMSLVGPRPPIPDEVDEYKGWQRRRLSMKPGITGLWQVSGRSKLTDFDKWVELDLEYIDNWSLLLDLKIFLRTVFVVFTGYGAH